MRPPILALVWMIFLLSGAAPAQDGGQADRLTPAEINPAAVKLGPLTLRVRLVKADNPPASIEVSFRRGLYWKRAGSLGKVKPGEWTSPFDCQEFFKGQGASDFVVVEFPGCRNFEAEYELAFERKALKTISERGMMDFSVIVIPNWILRSAAQPSDSEFRNGFMSLTQFNRERLARLDKELGPGPLPTRYAFEANFGGYIDPDTADARAHIWGRHSSLEALKAEMAILRHLGYNGFCGEGALRFAEKAGVRDQFLT